MASVFWDVHGILFIDYLEKGKTINSKYYMVLLDRLKEKRRKITSSNAKEKVVFQQNNAPCHKSMKTMAKLNELHFKLLSHPPFRPDLVSVTTGSFQTLKECYRERGRPSVISDALLQRTEEAIRALGHYLGGKSFHNDDEIKEVEMWFRQQAATFYLCGIQKLVRRLNKYLDNGGDHVEK
ncbi:putative DD34D transposase [Trichonephila clavipes]|nr:putative DD34D transposase [Trichonephila clavipes]